MSETVTQAPQYEDILNMTPADMRAQIRSGAYTSQTAGFAKGNLQANLAILEGSLADEFLEFCDRNNQPCPLVGVSGRGNPLMPGLGDIDIRTDIPSYNIYRHGVLTETRSDITELWNDQMVAFALGCSFTFERALADAGIPMKHIAANKTVPMYSTNIDLDPVGAFSGTMVVSMRAVPKDMVDKAIEITGSYPHAHGKPVHIGDGSAIGIPDLNAVDWGEPTEFDQGDVPVFWACGVTPQNVLQASKPPLCITHTPGRMLVTDVPEDVPPLVDRDLSSAA